MPLGIMSECFKLAVDSKALGCQLAITSPRLGIAELAPPSATHPGHLVPIAVALPSSRVSLRLSSRKGPEELGRTRPSMQCPGKLFDKCKVLIKLLCDKPPVSM